MLNLQIHPDQVECIADELASAGAREIGGVLVGEHLSDERFRLADFSVQHSGGTTNCFVCDPTTHESFLNDFFHRTQDNFTRFNYLGEWHSHPLFTVHPSETDIRQMQSLVDEESAPRLFAVLLVVRLGIGGCLEIGGLLFRAAMPPSRLSLQVIARRPQDGQPKRRSWWNRLRRGRGGGTRAVFTSSADWRT